MGHIHMRLFFTTCFHNVRLLVYFPFHSLSFEYNFLKVSHILHSFLTFPSYSHTQPVVAFLFLLFLRNQLSCMNSDFLFSILYWINDVYSLPSSLAKMYPSIHNVTTSFKLKNIYFLDPYKSYFIT